MKFRIFAIATFVIALLAVFVPANPAGAASSGEFVSDINGLRASKGLPALSVNASLTSFAQAWAQKMADAGSISHNPSLGSAPGKWSTVGENVGVGGSVSSIFDALVASSGHYANMVNSKFNAVGVGIATGSDGRIYTVHDFAAYPSSSGSTSSGTKSTPTTTKPASTTTPAAAKQHSTNATQSPATAAPSTSAASAAPTQDAAPTPEQTVTPALPTPSERIVQSLAEVSNISTQG